MKDKKISEFADVVQARVEEVLPFGALFRPTIRGYFLSSRGVQALSASGKKRFSLGEAYSEDHAVLIDRFVPVQDSFLGTPLAGYHVCKLPARMVLDKKDICRYLTKLGYLSYVDIPEPSISERVDLIGKLDAFDDLKSLFGACGYDQAPSTFFSCAGGLSQRDRTSLALAVLQKYSFLAADGPTDTIQKVYTQLRAFPAIRIGMTGQGGESCEMFETRHYMFPELVSPLRTLVRALDDRLHGARVLQWE